MNIPKQKLTDLLEQGIAFAPHYKPAFNSDHLPMALCAMAGLGAIESDVLAFRENYTTRLHLAAAGPDVDHWREGLGRSDCYVGLTHYFQRRLQSEGTQIVLEDVLPELLPGIALDAFHPVIRLGFAIDFEQPTEIAASLAYMTSVYRKMPVGYRKGHLASVIEQQVEQGPMAIESSRFSGSIVWLADNAKYPDIAATDLAEVAAMALDVYLATRNFFALHLVTATQAVRCAVPASLQHLGTAAMSNALLASHLVLGAPAVSTRVAAPAQLDREHALKYCWACLSEYRAYGDLRYLDEINGFVAAGLVPDWVGDAIRE